MTAEGPRHVVSRWLEAWNDHDLDRLDQLAAAGYRHHASNGRELDLAGFRAGLAAVLAAFPDMQYVVEHLIVEGDLVAAYVVGTASHQGPFLGLAPTQLPARFAGTYHARVEADRIVEDWDVFDLLTSVFTLGGSVTAAMG